jgi:putative FmdB family regulatory protein
MPIYENLCCDCGHELEALQKMTDDALIHCPECHGETLKKKISAAGFQLKGTGWYETDFKNSGAAPKGNAAAKSNSNPGNAPSGDGSSGGADKSSQTKSKGSTSSQAA